MSSKIGNEAKLTELTNTGVIIHHEQDSNVLVMAVSNEHLA